MTETSRLILEVDATSVKAGGVALDSLAVSGGKAEVATGALTKATDTLSRAYRDLAVAAVAWKAYEYIKDMAMLNARYTELGIVMQVVGRNAGYTATQMDQYAKATQHMGISMIESRNTVIQLAQAQIDLSHASKLARVAQDAAVIGQTNSSDALQRMIYGIKSGQTEVLRTLGINVSFEQSYKKLADSLHITTAALSEKQKMQARENAVMDEGAKLVGTYEAAMTSAGKQIRSMQRYTEDLKVMQGEVFNEALTVAVMAFTEHLKESNKEITALSKNGSLKEWGNDVADTFAFVVDAGLSVVSVTRMIGATVGWIAARASARETGDTREMLAVRTKAIDDAYTADLESYRNGTSRLRTALAERRAATAEDAIARKAKDFTEGYALRQGVSRPEPAAGKTSDSKVAKVSEYERLNDSIKKQNDLIDIELQFGTKQIASDKWHREEINKITTAYSHRKIKADEWVKATTEVNKVTEKMIALELQEALVKNAMESAQKRADERNKEYADIEAYMKQQVLDTMAADHAFVEATKSADLYIATLQKQYSREVDGVGKGTAVRANNAGLSAIEDRKTTAIQGYEKENRSGTLSIAMLNKYKEVAEATYESEVKAYNERTSAIEVKQSDWINGVTEAMANYQTSANDVAGQTANAFTKAFKGMEDALTSFVMTGKLDFNSLANSIVADITRIIIKQQISNAMGLAGSGGGGDWLGMAIGFLTGGGAGSNIGAYGGTMNNPSAYLAANGGVFTSPSLSAYSGQVVTTPTPFRFADGAGLMGEAGPEAIMPLKRGSDGKLGVQVSNSSSVVVNNTFVLSAPADKRTQQQVASIAGTSIQRALARNT